MDAGGGGGGEEGGGDEGEGRDAAVTEGRTVTEGESQLGGLQWTLRVEFTVQEIRINK